MIADLMPRARYLTEPLRRDEPPLSPDSSLIARLPAAIWELTGAIHRASMPHQGRIGLVLELEAERGHFVLKVVQGRYRSQELEAEHNAMQLLAASSVPVPRSLAFVQEGALGFQLRAYSPGQPLSAVLAEEESLRPEAVRQMGQCLASIHGVGVEATARTWSDWIEASLEGAAASTGDSSTWVTRTTT